MTLNRARSVTWLACLLLVLPVPGAMAEEEARPPVRREERITFEVDATLQERGGVQYFYELIDQEQDALARESFAKLQPLDARGRWAGSKEPLHVLVSRIVYTLDKDVAFFTAERVRDVAYMNTILPGADIRRKAPASTPWRRRPPTASPCATWGARRSPPRPGTRHWSASCHSLRSSASRTRWWCRRTSTSRASWGHAPAL
ncbi:hypothetical protein ACN28S_51330 [Cystobacter fuscus]